MTNKELAVQVWTALLQATATLAASPNFSVDAVIPSPQRAVDEISALADMLSQIEEK